MQVVGVLGELLARESGRYPELHIGCEELKGLRHHADDEVWLVVDGDRAANDSRIAAEAVLPEAEGENDHLGFRPVILRQQNAADECLCAEDFEERAGGTASAHAQRLPVVH
jgi:hypothetical protein